MAFVDIGEAQPRDDEALRRLVRQMPMSGLVRIAYCREPSFFDALCLEGRSSQVIGGRDRDTGQLIGLGSRSVKPCYVDGEPMPVGYLSSLRILPDYRRSTLLARAYRFLERLHLQDGQVRVYLSTILESNEAARQVLESGRAGLPTYTDLGRFVAMAISTRQRPARHPKDPAGIVVRPAAGSDIPALLELFGQHGSRRQFFPQYEPADFGDRGLLQGLGVDSILLAMDGARLVGSLAVWDQSALKQSLVTGYSTSFGRLRPLYNTAARFLGYPLLPPAGQLLRFAYLGLVCAADDDPGLAGALLREALSRAASRYPFLMAGMHERDPLLPALLAYRHFSYPSRLYAVHWSDGAAKLKSLSDRVPYLEIGAL